MYYVYNVYGIYVRIHTCSSLSRYSGEAWDHACPFAKKKKTCIAVNTAPSVNPDNVIQSLEVDSLPAGGDMQRLKLLLLVAIASLFVRHPLGQQGAAEAHYDQPSVDRAAHALPLLPREEAVGESTMGAACGTHAFQKTVYLHRSSEVLVHQS